MSLIDKAVAGNRNYAKTPDPKLRQRPAPRLAVVTCTDPRLSDLPAILGLQHADLDVIRTAGPAVTEDVLGELVASNRINRNDGDYASKSYWLRVHYLHRRAAKHQTS
jgi:carbonic anhydrase